jgi:multiple sugar transport system substrate-binding protein
MEKRCGIAKRVFASGSAALLATLVLAAPGGARAADVLTLKVWMHEHPPRLALDPVLIAEFEKQNPNIKVELTVIPPADFDQKLEVAFASGAGPDVFNQDNFVLGQYYSAGIIAPVDLAAVGVASNDDLDKRYGSGIAGVTLGGKIYGFPTEVSNYACVANKELWAKAGLNPATDAPKTWEQMVDVATKLTVRDKDGNPVQRGFDFNWSAPIFMWLTFNSMVDQLGGTLVDETKYTANLNSPQVAKTLGYWSDWVNKYKLGGPQYTQSRDAFLAKELATECTFGSWGKGQFQEAKIDYAFFPAPRWKDGPVDTGFNSYAYYMMVNARTDAAKQPAAWKFANFYASQAVRLYEVAGLFTTVPAVAELPSYKADPSNAVFHAELAKAEFSPRVAGFNQIADALARARDRVVVGHEDVSPVLADLQGEVTGILNRVKPKQ